ncbi:DinB/UmuC family translesion DNA polymerase [Aeromonas veronii]|uniref:DinB/UmuC family translesion DNA polymerase n=1 Tax=Aeromonas veronii TaxID=654 RepID=UPI0040555847
MKLLTPDPSPAEVTIPLFLHRASCGFPSPASDYLEGKLDLNTHCVAHPAATFYLRAEGVCCQRVLLFVRTSPFDERAPDYSEQAGVRLVCPSDDTRLLLQQVNVLLPQIRRDGYRYQKGDVMLSEFTPQGAATGRPVCLVLRSIRCADGSDGPDQSQGIGARRICQPRRGVA